MEYTVEQLRDRGIEAFRRLSARYGTAGGQDLAVGEGPVTFRVSHTGALLAVIRYRVRFAGGQWSEVKEYTEEL